MQTILLVEAEPVERTALSRALERAGYRVEANAGTHGALAAVSRRNFDLAVVSSLATESRHIDLVHWLRQRTEADSMPILVVGAEAGVKPRMAALCAGADDHLARPFDTDHLLSRVRNLLNRRDNLPSLAPQGFGRRILLVDDSLTYAHALLEELAVDGHDVALAENGADALTFLERHRADLVILDVFLPDGNGIEICRRIKQAPRTAALPVLVLTGREKSVVRDAATSALADDFAVKSRDFAAIRQKVRGLLVRNPQRTPSSGKLPAAEAPHGRSPSFGRLPAMDATAQRAMDGQCLFDDIVRGTGLSELLARSTVESVCRRLELDPRSLRATDLPRIVDGLTRTLSLFLPPQEAEARLAALQTLAP